LPGTGGVTGVVMFVLCFDAAKDPPHCEGPCLD